MNILPGHPSRKTWFFFIALAVIIAARLVVQLLLHQHGFSALTGDDYGRVVEAAIWAERGGWQWSGFWLPTYNYLYGIALLIHWDLSLTPRLVSIAFGVFSMAGMGWLGMELFHDHRVALLAVFLMGINPLHIWLSSVPLSEIGFITFYIFSAAALACYFNQGSQPALFLSAAMLLLGNGFRFESWMVSIVFSLLLAWQAALDVYRTRRFDIQKILPVGICALIPWLLPLGWLVGNYAQYGDPLYFLTFTETYKSTKYGTGFDLFRYPAAIWKIDPFFLILALPGLAYGVAQAKSKKFILAMGAFAVLPLAIFIFFHKGRVDMEISYLRYMTPFISVVYPWTAALIVAVSVRLLRQSWARAALLLVVLAVMAANQLPKAFNVQNDDALLGLGVGNYIRSYRQQHPESANENALTEFLNWQYLAVHVGASDLHHIIYDRAVGFSPRKPSSLLGASSDQIRACLIAYQVRLVSLKTPETQQAFEQATQLEPTTLINGYRIYVLPKSLAVPEVTCTLTFDSIR
jgi:hypothetical protein